MAVLGHNFHKCQTSITFSKKIELRTDGSATVSHLSHVVWEWDIPSKQNFLGNWTTKIVKSYYFGVKSFSEFPCFSSWTEQGECALAGSTEGIVCSLTVMSSEATYVGEVFFCYIKWSQIFKFIFLNNVLPSSLLSGGDLSLCTTVSISACYRFSFPNYFLSC